MALSDDELDRRDFERELLAWRGTDPQGQVNVPGRLMRRLVEEVLRLREERRQYSSPRGAPLSAGQMDDLRDAYGPRRWRPTLATSGACADVPALLAHVEWLTAELQALERDGVAHAYERGRQDARGEPGPWVRLGDLREGAVFETRDGTQAVKSEYTYTTGGQCQCVLLASGEYAHFEAGNDTPVRELPPPGAR